MRLNVSLWVQQKLLELGVVVFAPAFVLCTPALAAAQDTSILAVQAYQGYPVAIHEGTCTNLTTEPTYDLGLMQPRPLVGGGDDTAAGMPLLDEDLDDDGVVDDDEDLDDDGVLDLGFDVDASGALGPDELLDHPVVWSLLGDLGDLDAANGDGDDTEPVNLRDTPHAIVIHGGTIRDNNYLACGEIAGVAVNGEIVIPLWPVNQDWMTSVAELEEGDNGVLGIGANGGEFEIHAWPRRVPFAPQAVATSTPMSKPEPATPASEPTATPVGMEIPTDFEERGHSVGTGPPRGVPAPEAGASMP